MTGLLQFHHMLKEIPGMTYSLHAGNIILCDQGTGNKFKFHVQNHSWSNIIFLVEKNKLEK
jgi:hypothetical protein